MSERSANQNPNPAPRINAPPIQIHPRGPIDPIDSIRLALGISAHADPIVAIARLRASLARADEALRIKEELNEALRQSEDRLRAANARLRALVIAHEGIDLNADFAEYTRNLARLCDASRAVEEAGDLEEPTG